MGDVVLQQGGVHKLSPGVREPQHTRVRGYPIWPWRDRFTPLLEFVLAREGDIPEEAAPTTGDPWFGNERTCLKVLGIVLEMVDDIVDDFLGEDALHGGDVAR